MGLITIDTFDTDKFSTLCIEFIIPFVVVFIIWCILLSKCFQWRPFLVARYVIAHGLKKERSSFVTTICSLLWWIFFSLPFLIAIAFGVLTAYYCEPITVGITIAVAPCALLLLLLAFQYYAAQGYRPSLAVVSILVLSFILIFGVYIAVVLVSDPLNWSGTGYLFLLPSICFYAWVLCFDRISLEQTRLSEVYANDENKEKFIQDLEDDKFDYWFEGAGKLRWWWGIIIILVSVLFDGIFIAVWYKKPEKEATIGTACASILIDFLLVLSQFSTKDNSQTLLLLFVGYVMKMVCVSFKADYWFVGHGFLFLAQGVYYLTRFLNWLMITVVIKTHSGVSTSTDNEKFSKEIQYALKKLNPEYVRPSGTETILTVIALILLVAAAAVELIVYNSDDLRILPFDMTQRDAYIALVVLTIVLGCVFSSITTLKKNKYNLQWTIVAVFLAGNIAAAVFFYLFNGLKVVNDLRILIFLIFYYIFGTVFEAMIIHGNGNKLIREGGVKQLSSICAIFFLILAIADPICLIVLPFIFNDFQSLGLMIFLAATALLLYVGFCVSFLHEQHFTCLSALSLVGAIVFLIGLCANIFVVTEGYFLCVAVAGIVLALALIIFAILWTQRKGWRFTLGPMLIICITSLAIFIVCIVGYIMIEAYDTLCLLVGLIMAIIFFGALIYFLLTRNRFNFNWIMWVLSVIMVLIVIAAIVLLFLELKSFFASISALFAIVFICSIIVIGGYVATSSKTDVIIFNDLFFPVRRLFNGKLTNQGFFRVLMVLIFVLPWFWGLLGIGLLKWPEYGSLGVSAGFAILIFLMLSFIYNFDSKALLSVEYMTHEAIDFAVNKAIHISGVTVDDEFPPDTDETFEQFMDYANARTQAFLDQSKFESALKAQLYITAEIAFERVLDKCERYFAQQKVVIPFLKQDEFTPIERKRVFNLSQAIFKSNETENKKDSDYLKFVKEQEDKRQESLTKALLDKTDKVGEFGKILAQGLKEKKFVDKDFHPNGKIAERDPNLLANVEWKRAEELFHGPFVQKTDPNELCQGGIGDCYLVSAMSVISREPKLVNSIFTQPDKVQSSGAACVRINAMGKEIHCIVDTQLPCSTKSGKVKFVSPRDPEKSAWWFTLVEKAFAKQNGSYSAIVGGNSHVALYRMLGGWPENFDLDSLEMKEQINNGTLWANILKWQRENNFLCCGSHSGSDTTKNKANIVQGHAYSINNVVEIKGFQLLQLRNPWGDGEWNGDWSDKSPLWQKHADIARTLGHADVDDGMFWINFKDFCANYSSLYICLNLGSSWKKTDIFGKFEPGDADGAKPVTAGPGANLLKQYLVKFKRPTTVKLTFEKTGPNAPIWIYAVYNKGEQVRKIMKGMVYKTEAVAPNAILQSFEWEFTADQVQFPWTFVVCRTKTNTPNDWMLRLWCNQDIDPVDEIAPSAGGPPPHGAKPGGPPPPRPGGKPGGPPPPKAAAPPPKKAPAKK